MQWAVESQGALSKEAMRFDFHVHAKDAFAAKWRMGLPSAASPGRSPLQRSREESRVA